MDTNVLLDLAGTNQRQRPDRSQVLLAQHLADRIELMVSRGLERDLDQSAADERERVLAAASEYPRPRGSSTRAQSLFNAMNTAVTTLAR